MNLRWFCRFYWTMDHLASHCRCSGNTTSLPQHTCRGHKSAPISADCMVDSTCFLAPAAAACFQEQQQRLQYTGGAMRRPQVPLA
jgi:hypothetical protein